MLGHTDVDVLGRELRVPFPSFALVFTDREVLSLGERLLSRDAQCAVAGHLLKVATVYVIEHAGVGDRGRALEITFAFDALGADPPALVRHSLGLRDDEPVQGQLDVLAPGVVVEPAVEQTSPLRGLLGVVVNAILYATSTGVEPELRAPSPPRARARSAEPPRVFTSDEVYFLPGAISISALRQHQTLERLPDGKAILRRFMVRGHWRRPAHNWTDQRLRWIKPHWKGPDMAAIIERTYRLER